jgi:hypothetical protein
MSRNIWAKINANRYRFKARDAYMQDITNDLLKKHFSKKEFPRLQIVG